jgi:hypothetical protein
MFYMKEIPTPSEARALHALRTELQTFLFTADWYEDDQERPYTLFSGDAEEHLRLLAEDIAECGWLCSLLDEQRLRIIAPIDSNPSSEILPTPAEVEVFCKNLEMMRVRIKNVNPDPLIQNEIIFPAETPERVMRALVHVLETQEWSVERDGKVRILVSQ